MDVIIANRQEGKTTTLIKQSSTTGAIIVCPTSEMCKYVMFKAEEMQLEIPEPISFNQFLYSRKNRNDHFLIDELSLCLSPMNVDTATLNKSHTKKFYGNPKYKAKTFCGSFGKDCITADEEFNAWQEEQQKQGKDIEIINFRYCQARYGDHSIAILYKEI